MNSQNRLPIISAVALVLVVVVITVALSHHQASGTMAMSSSSPSAAQVSSAVATNAVTISNYAFSPASIKIKVGTTVTWTNQDPVEHTVTVNSGSGPMSMLIARGQSFSYTFKQAGTYSYHCTPHPYMKATVIVTAS
jgi:amicyanin